MASGDGNVREAADLILQAFDIYRTRRGYSDRDPDTTQSSEQRPNVVRANTLATTCTTPEIRPATVVNVNDTSHHSSSNCPSSSAISEAVGHQNEAVLRSRSSSEQHSSSYAVRLGGQGPNLGIGEHRRLFGGYQPSRQYNRKKGKGSTSGVKIAKPIYWKKNSFCLASCCQILKPTPQQKIQLATIGLTTKVLHFEVGGTAHHVHSIIIQEYPILEDCGGYTLLRLAENSHDLVEIEEPLDALIDVEYLKNILNNATLYIRPLQRDICSDDMKQAKLTEVLEDAPSELCHSCGLIFTLPELRKHVVICKKVACKEVECKESKDKDQSQSAYVLHDDVNECTWEDLPGPSTVDYPLNSPGLSPTNSIMDDEEEQEANKEVSEIFRAPRTLKDIVEMLRCKVDKDSEFDMVVRRSHVLRDALRRMDKATFDPRKRLNVVFVGEEGTDTGGLSREFFRLVCYSMGSQYLECTGCFRHDATAYQERIYRRLGILAAMALVHGGGSFLLFCPTVFKYLHGIEASQLIATIEEVPDQSVRDTLLEIHSVTDENEMREVASRNIDLLLECGFTKPVALLKLGDKSDLIHAVTLHKVVLCSLAELDQFRDGMAALGVADSLQQYHPLYASFYCMGSGDSLTSDGLRKLFTVIRFSNKGTSNRVKEETAFSYFIEYLDACEGVVATAEKSIHMHGANEDVSAESSEDKVSLAMVLSFFTGADSVPPCGYNQVVLNFSATSPYPTASTCAMELTLPTKYNEYTEFKNSLDIAFTMHGGFGLM